MSNYATEKQLKHDTGVDISNLAAEKDFIALKAEVDQLEFSRAINVITGLNNLRTKVSNLDDDMLKTVSVNLRKD